jgi:hypothetical protein
MNKSNSTTAEQIAQAAIAFEQRRTGNAAAGQAASGRHYRPPTDAIFGFSFPTACIISHPVRAEIVPKPKT